jgi:hypothetical protein
MELQGEDSYIDVNLGNPLHLGHIISCKFKSRSRFM